MPPASRPDLLQGTLDMMILKTLSPGPNHGYGIARRIRQVSDEVLTVEEGSLYPALHRLEKRGYVRSEWQRSDANRRAKYYTLTRSGTARLKAETAEWQQLATAIGKVMSAERAAAVEAAR
jgi:PadR family transcriptional regulator, regulatory protein PadR